MIFSHFYMSLTPKECSETLNLVRFWVKLHKIKKFRLSIQRFWQTLSNCSLWSSKRFVVTPCNFIYNRHRRWRFVSNYNLRSSSKRWMDAKNNLFDFLEKSFKCSNQCRIYCWKVWLSVVLIKPFHCSFSLHLLDSPPK